MKTHEFAHRPPEEVFNQPAALEDYNLFEHDTPLREALHREGGGWAEGQVFLYGALLGKPENLLLGVLANRNLPELHSHDRSGNRIDEVEYHPAYHALMRLGIERGLHAMPWKHPQSEAHVVRGALMMMRHQLDEGTSCPLTMTFAVIPSLRLQPELAAEWEQRVLSTEYDPRSIPAPYKNGVLFGMAMTERQGGSDVQGNTTRAAALGREGPGEEYALTGHKWFCSAPMCDAFLALARTEKGLTCFLLPRWTPDGKRNAFHIMRLKDKLGNRSNASAEVEFHAAWARMLGEEGRGVSTIIEMVRHTRLDCALGSAASLRRALAETLHHTSQRRAFGERLIDQPLMKNVLADLCLESEAATALALRLARSFDESAGSESARQFSRIATATGKYWITKRASAVVVEALECLGGSGYVEESPMARLYRDIPINSIWEGSGNVQCLDVLRTLHKEPDALEVVLDELRAARGGNLDYDSVLERFEWEIRDPADLELRARRVIDHLALLLQASILVQHAPAAVSEAFCASRLAGDMGSMFGTLPAGVDFDAIIARSWPR